jgi:hypothetical protein
MCVLQHSVSFVVETLQSFINKHVVDLENVQRSKKKEKGEVPRCQVSSK